MMVESTCILCRAELSYREPGEGQSPWSIRQTSVYLRLSTTPNPPKSLLPTSKALSKLPKSTFILIAPSWNIEAQLAKSLEINKLDEWAIGLWNIYQLLVANSLRGWMDYMAYLEEGLRD